MASDFPGSPRVLKGALVVFETPVPVPTNIIAFQYNPDQVTPHLPAAARPRRRPVPQRGRHERVLPPTETLPLTRRARRRPTSSRQATRSRSPTGLHPTLAALELLLYPPSTDLILDKALALAARRASGRRACRSSLLVWGPLRVVPVRVESVSITEEAFDPLLNPIRAKVELEPAHADREGAEQARAAVRRARARQPDRQGGLARGAARRLGDRRSAGRLLRVPVMFAPGSRYAQVPTARLHRPRRPRAPLRAAPADPVAAGADPPAPRDGRRRAARPRRRARYFGDPEQFWRICDVNRDAAARRRSRSPGRRIAIPLVLR